MLFPMLTCAASLAGCTVSPDAGAGFQRLTPAPATAEWIVANDRPFARQVAAHNRQCDANQGCRK